LAPLEEVAPPDPSPLDVEVAPAVDVFSASPRPATRPVTPIVAASAMAISRAYPDLRSRS